MTKPCVCCGRRYPAPNVKVAQGSIHWECWDEEEDA